MKKYIVNFDEVSVSTVVTKAQVEVSEEDYLKLAQLPELLNDMLNTYNPDYGEPDEVDFEIDELEIVHMFEK